jgi:hypothetical protein
VRLKEKKILKAYCFFTVLSTKIIGNIKTFLLKIIKLINLFNLASQSKHQGVPRCYYKFYFELKNIFLKLEDHCIIIKYTEIILKYYPGNPNIIS